MDGRTEGWKDGRTEGRTDGRTNEAGAFHCHIVKIILLKTKMKKYIICLFSRLVARDIILIFFFVTLLHCDVKKTGVVIVNILKNIKILKISFFDLRCLLPSTIKERNKRNRKNLAKLRNFCWEYWQVTYPLTRIVLHYALWLASRLCLSAWKNIF